MWASLGSLFGQTKATPVASVWSGAICPVPAVPLAGVRFQMRSRYQIKRKVFCNDMPKNVRWVCVGIHKTKLCFAFVMHLMPIAGQAPRKFFHRLRELKETPLNYFLDLGKKSAGSRLVLCT